MTQHQACADCGKCWPGNLLSLVPLEGCPECRPEAWRSFGSSGDERFRAPSEQPSRL